MAHRKQHKTEYLLGLDMLFRTSDCDQSRLRKLLHGALPESDQQNVARHLEQCADCRQQMEAFAGPPDWWTQTRESLSGLSCNQDSYLADGDNASPPESTTPSIPLDFLHPSDNPAMLGRLGEFEILEEIGCGGMGIVLKGYDHELNRYVAVKVLHPYCATSAAARRRFAREAQAAAAIVHQHVVAIHAVDANHHPPYLVMPFVPGESLQQRLARQGTLELLDALRIGQQVAEGLAAAHAQGLVHRDIKPGNILLERNVERVLLTDFGLARAADDASLTHSGVIAGTPQYMSPEQARGEQIDHRTDLFSLGSVLYTMLAGHSPFRAETAMSVLRRVCDDTPRPLRSINPAVPEWLDAFIARLHQKQAAQRFENAATVARLLQQAIAHLQQPTVVSLPPEITAMVQPPAVQPVPWQTELVTAAIVIPLVIIGLLLVGGPRQQTTSTPAPRKLPTPATAEPVAWDDGVQTETNQLDQIIRRWESDSPF